MTASRTMKSSLAGAAVGVLLLVASASAPVSAEQLPNPGRTVGSDRDTAPPHAAPRNSPGVETRGRPWSLEDALPDHSSALRANKPDATTDSRPDLGRIPLQSGAGSFGLETETKVKPNQLPDGRPIPGLQSTARETPSYFGLSLSVPAGGKSLPPPGPP